MTSTMQKKQKISTSVFNKSLYIEALKRLRVAGLAVAIIALTIAILVPVISWINYRPYAPDEENVYIDGYDDYGNPIYEEGADVGTRIHTVSEAELCSPLYGLPFLAPIFILVLFSFLHKRKQSDFFHAIPYTRTCVYLSFVSAALSFMFAIQILSAVSAGLIYAICPYTTFALWDLVELTLLSMLSAAFLSSFMMLAITLTGTIETTAFLFFVFAAFTRFACYLIGLILYDNVGIIKNDQYPFLSYLWYLPFRTFNYLADAANYPRISHLVIYTLIVTVALFAAAGFFYVKRRSEMAERPAPSRRMQDVFRSLVTLPVAFLFVYLLRIGEDDFSIWVTMLAMILLVYFLYELITTRKIKNLAPAGRKLWLVLVGTLLFFGVSAAAESYIYRNIPKKEIESVTVLGSSGYVNNFEDYALEKVSYTDEKIVSLVSGALDASVTSDKKDMPFGKPTTRHVVYFHLKNGTTVQRVVSFTEDSEKALSNLLVESETYTDAFLSFPDVEILTDTFCHIDENTSSHYLYVHFYDWQETETFIALFKEEYETLTKEEKLYVKQYCTSSAYAWNEESSSISGKIETKAVAPYYDDKDLVGDGSFAVKVQMTGKIPSGRYLSSTYAIHPKMTKTLTFALALFEREKENYVTYEKSDFTYHNSTDSERILTAVTILEDIKNGSVLPSIGSADRYGTATISIYGENTAAFKLVYAKEGGDPLQTALIDTLSETLWSSTEQHDDTVLMLFSLDVNGVKMYGSAFMLLRVSRADADALLEALRACNYLK